MSHVLAIKPDIGKLFGGERRVALSSANEQIEIDDRSYLKHFLQPISANPAYFFDLEISDIRKECDKSGWDGYGALPLNEESAVRAKSFFTRMPRWAWVPDIVPAADGCIVLQWGDGKVSLLTFSFKPDGRIIYAGRFSNGTSAYGTELFDDEIPDTLLEFISRALQ